MQRTETIVPDPLARTAFPRRRVGLLFPGQGAQYVGMGKALAEAFPLARQTFEEADDALGEAMSRRVWEGTPEDLEVTARQQPAILTVSIAVWRVLHARFPLEPVAAMGLSLGEYSAYVAAGLLPFAEAVRVTRRRGEAMQEAVPAGEGGMVAVLGLETARVEELAREAARSGWAEPANYNAPGQIVVAGTLPALAALEELVAREGSGRTVRLPVSAPFHSRLLAPVEPVLAEALAGCHLAPARFPVVANVDGCWCRSPSEAVDRLIRQVSRPVRFEQGVRSLLAAGVDELWEIGPGRTLSGLVRRIDRSVPTRSLEDPEGLARALESV